MDFHVSLQGAFLSEGGATFLANVGSFLGVDAAVHVQVPLGSKVPVTLPTLERLLHGVNPLVIQQGGLMGKRLTAKSTLKWFLPSMDALVDTELMDTEVRGL